MPQESIPEAGNRYSGTLLAELSRWLSHEFGQSDQVVCCATEDEQPVHFLQTSQLDLTQSACLLEPAEALFNQPSPAQANGIAGLTRGSAVPRLLRHPCGDSAGRQAVPLLLEFRDQRLVDRLRDQAWHPVTLTTVTRNRNEREARLSQAPLVLLRTNNG